MHGMLRAHTLARILLIAVFLALVATSPTFRSDGGDAQLAQATATVVNGGVCTTCSGGGSSSAPSTNDNKAVDKKVTTDTKTGKSTVEEKKDDPCASKNKGTKIWTDNKCDDKKGKTEVTEQNGKKLELSCEDGEKCGAVTQGSGGGGQQVTAEQMAATQPAIMQSAMQSAVTPPDAATQRMMDDAFGKGFSNPTPAYSTTPQQSAPSQTGSGISNLSSGSSGTTDVPGTTLGTQGSEMQALTDKVMRDQHVLMPSNTQGTGPVTGVAPTMAGPATGFGGGGIPQAPATTFMGLQTPLGGYPGTIPVSSVFAGQNSSITVEPIQDSPRNLSIATPTADGAYTGAQLKEMGYQGVDPKQSYGFVTIPANTEFTDRNGKVVTAGDLSQSVGDQMSSAELLKHVDPSTQLTMQYTQQDGTEKNITASVKDIFTKFEDGGVSETAQSKVVNPIVPDNATVLVGVRGLTDREVADKARQELGHDGAVTVVRMDDNANAIATQNPFRPDYVYTVNERTTFADKGEVVAQAMERDGASPAMVDDARAFVNSQDESRASNQSFLEKTKDVMVGGQVVQKVYVGDQKQFQVVAVADVPRVSEPDQGLPSTPLEPLKTVEVADRSDPGVPYTTPSSDPASHTNLPTSRVEVDVPRTSENQTLLRDVSNTPAVGAEGRTETIPSPIAVNRNLAALTTEGPSTWSVPMAGIGNKSIVEQSPAGALQADPNPADVSSPVPLATPNTVPVSPVYRASPSALETIGEVAKAAALLPFRVVGAALGMSSAQAQPAPQLTKYQDGTYWPSQDNTPARAAMADTINNTLGMKPKQEFVQAIEQAKQNGQATELQVPSNPNNFSYQPWNSKADSVTAYMAKMYYQGEYARCQTWGCVVQSYVGDDSQNGQANRAAHIARSGMAADTPKPSAGDTEGWVKWMQAATRAEYGTAGPQMLNEADIRKGVAQFSGKVSPTTFSQSTSAKNPAGQSPNSSTQTTPTSRGGAFRTSSVPGAQPAPVPPQSERRYAFCIGSSSCRVPDATNITEHNYLSPKDTPNTVQRIRDVASMVGTPSGGIMELDDCDKMGRETCARVLREVEAHNAANPGKKLVVWINNPQLSDSAGKPLAELLKDKNAGGMIAESDIRNSTEQTRPAVLDALRKAAGKPEMPVLVVGTAEFADRFDASAQRGGHAKMYSSVSAQEGDTPGAYSDVRGGSAVRGAPDPTTPAGVVKHFADTRPDFVFGRTGADGKAGLLDPKAAAVARGRGEKLDVYERASAPNPFDVGAKNNAVKDATSGQWYQKRGTADEYIAHARAGAQAALENGARAQQIGPRIGKAVTVEGSGSVRPVYALNQDGTRGGQVGRVSTITGDEAKLKSVAAIGGVALTQKDGKWVDANGRAVELRAVARPGSVDTAFQSLARGGGTPQIPGSRYHTEFWRPLNSAPRDGVIGIISHQSHGPVGSGRNTARSQAGGPVGAEWWILADGTRIHSDGERATGNVGKNNPPGAPTLIGLMGLGGGGMLGNARSVGIEFEGMIGQSLTPAQIESGKELIAFLQERYGLPSESILKHGKGPNGVEGEQMEQIARAMRYVPGTGLPYVQVFGLEKDGTAVPLGTPVSVAQVGQVGTTTVFESTDDKGVPDGKVVAPLASLPDIGKADAALAVGPDGSLGIEYRYSAPAQQDQTKDSLRDIAQRAMAAAQHVQQQVARTWNDMAQQMKNMFGGQGTPPSGGGTPTPPAQPQGSAQPTPASRPTSPVQPQQSPAAQSGYQTSPVAGGVGTSDGGAGVGGASAPVLSVQDGAQARGGLGETLLCTPGVVVSNDTKTPVLISWTCPTGTRAVGGGFSTLGAQSGTLSSVLATTSPTVTYKLRCDGSSNPQTLSCVVRVLHPQVTLLAQPATLASGAPTELRWNAKDLDACSVYAPPATLLVRAGATGQATTLPIGQNSIFRIVCNYRGVATTTGAVVVRVSGDTSEPIETVVP